MATDEALASGAVVGAPLLAGGVVVAGPLLAWLFGVPYAEGARALQWLLLSLHWSPMDYGLKCKDILFGLRGYSNH